MPVPTYTAPTDVSVGGSTTFTFKTGGLMNGKYYMCLLEERVSLGAGRLYLTSSHTLCAVEYFT